MLLSSILEQIWQENNEENWKKKQDFVRSLVTVGAKMLGL